MTHPTHTPPPPPYARPNALSDEELSAIWRAKLMFRALVLVGTILALTIMASLAAGIWLIRGTQLHNTRLAEETHSTAELIRSCVNPEGKCYADGQKRTGDAVANIGTTSVAAAACSVHIGLEHPELSQDELIRQVAVCTTRAVTRP
jgi:hypothetical protein